MTNYNLKKYLPSFVYGGSDGAVSYFTLMAGAYGAGMSINMLIAIGISNVIADAFSMASADYLSEDSKSKENKKENIKNASVTFISFIILGLFPLSPTIYAYYKLSPDSTLPPAIFLMSCVLTFIGFTYIGYLRGKILNRNLINTIFQSIFICTLSASVAYYIGEYVTILLQ
jgi:VIT1/CCC1 family predicted Fe2+/Mn2+ transporter